MMRRNRRSHFQMTPADYVFNLTVAEAMTIARLDTMAAGRDFSWKEFVALSGAPPAFLTRLKKDGLIAGRQGRFGLTEAGRVAAATAKGIVRANVGSRGFGSRYGADQYPYEPDEDPEWDFGPPMRGRRW